MKEKDLLTENNAMLKVLLHNQAMSNIILQELFDWLNADASNVPESMIREKLDLRNELADINFQKLIQQVKALKSINAYDHEFLKHAV